MALDVVELDALERWLPLRPTVAITEATGTATVTGRDADGVVRTDLVSVAVARQLLPR